MKQKVANPDKNSVKELNPWPSYIQVKKFIYIVLIIQNTYLSKPLFNNDKLLNL